jgi:hypothetical protein
MKRKVKRMNIVEEQESKRFYLGVFPKCPFYNSVLLLVLLLGLIALGTVGLSFLNFWVAIVYVIYAVLFYFLVMPLKHCQYCYYKVKEAAKGKWKESYLKKHVDCGKKWAVNFFILWFGPIVLIGISFFLSFSIYALISLIGFIIMLAIMVIYLRRKICPTCAIVDECHAAF